MPDLNLTKDKIPFWLSGNGTLTVHANIQQQLNQPLAPTDADLFSVDFGARGNEAFSFGSPNNLKLGIQAGASAKLTPLWKTSSEQRRAVLADHEMSKFFEAHPDEMILALNLGANADVNLAGSFSYS